MKHATADEIRRLHRKRLAAWDLPVFAEHEDLVVERVLKTLNRADTYPIAFGHAHEEMGGCVECDAAAVLAAI